ncbi:hypothetical protein [Acidithiobacillus ferriphilus]|uniref:hypothetical protein n=1 Tax=Acidithiobacillus ferriphilus TaxID=1689834 RepID=UPI001C069002|nr:hypothetical protein [Acidithiobacillus ferriphilus]MBU2833028.1 hypothetical protein [Acidithiobacillus ferriphilus]
MEEREADIVRYVTQQALLGNAACGNAPLPAGLVGELRIPNASIIQEKDGVNYMRSGSKRCPLAAITNSKAFYAVHSRMQKAALRKRGLSR